MFGSKKTSSFTLAISLKSSSVDVQLIHHTSGLREVVFVQRKIILLDDSRDPHVYTEQCISELSELLRSSSKSIHQICGGSISQTQIILYAPWFTSDITSINHKENVVITERFLNEQLNTIKTSPKLVSLEKKVIKIHANGYTVSELSKLKMSNVSLDVYSSYISETIYKTLTVAIKKNLPCVKNISYVTSPLLIFRQIRTLLVQEDNVSFFYIGGEITEIGIIEDDALSFYATFPIGKHDFLREVQSGIKSYDYDLLYQKQLQIKPKIKQVKFDQLKEQWSQVLISSLFSYKKGVPSKLLIISDSKTKDFFTEILTSKIKNTPDTSFIQYRIINFDISHLKDIIPYKTPTNTNELDLQLEALI